jgi:hypothetical protein
MSGGVELDIYGDDWNLDNIETAHSQLAFPAR